MGVYHILDVLQGGGALAFCASTEKKGERVLFSWMNAIFKSLPQTGVPSNQIKRPPIGVVLATFICRQKVTDYMYWWIWHQYSFMTIFNVLSEVFVCKKCNSSQNALFYKSKSMFKNGYSLQIGVMWFQGAVPCNGEPPSLPWLEDRDKFYTSKFAITQKPYSELSCFSRKLIGFRFVMHFINKC